jgi:hypothetical protein
VGRPTALKQVATAEPGHVIALNQYELTREAAMAAFAKSWRRYSPTAPLAQRCAT